FFSSRSRLTSFSRDWSSDVCSSALAFRTTSTKSRLNFLSLLRGSYQDYVLNDAAFAHLERCKADPALVARLETREPQVFPNQLQLLKHLVGRKIDIFDKPLIRMLGEAGIWGSIRHHGLLGNTVIVSDDAGQFRVGNHALCRVGGDVTIPTPHRPGRADFPHPVPHGKVWLTAANFWAILGGGSGWRFRISLRRVHRTTLWRSRRDNHFCHILTT